MENFRNLATSPLEMRAENFIFQYLQFDIFHQMFVKMIFGGQNSKIKKIRFLIIIQICFLVDIEDVGHFVKKIVSSLAAEFLTIRV